MTLHSINFSPRILYDAFGSKNIEVDSIAFAEQIKNSFDAHAKNVTLDFRDYNEDRIKILDDGVGMNEKELKENWLLVGTESKTSDEDALGGKGVGRFSLFRIANTITIITKKEGHPEYEMSLEKDTLKNLEFTKDSKIDITENKIPKHFNKNSDSGTIIILTNIKRIDFNEIFYDLHNLIQPDKKSSIPTKVHYLPKELFNEQNVMSIDEALMYAPFKCKASFVKNNLIKYHFICKIKDRILYENKNIKRLSSNFSKLDPIDLGTIDFTLYNYYFYSKYVNLLSIPQKEIQKNFLNIYQGISVYREDFKIYGHGKTDWLNLAEKRVASPSKCIDNKLSFGYVSLRRPQSDRLEEKTNREGFLKGDIYDYFKNAIELLIDEFNRDRAESISIITYGKTINKKTKNKTENKFKLIEEIVKDNLKNKKQDRPNFENNDFKNKPIDIDNTNINNHKQSKKKASNSNNQIKDIEEPKNNSNKNKQEKSAKKPRPKYSNKVIIDVSFECPESAPEKIKRIIYELQTIEHRDSKPALYAQALLLRCLIDISTQYAKKQLNLEKNKENKGKPNLLGNIKSVLNKIYRDNLLPDKKKHIKELQSFLKEDSTIEYFNGIAHDYDYRTHFKDIKEVWDKFEFYISFCIEQ
ncbi:ATP-binding protein [Anaerosalibacter massiliensis]|uniref:ATP-binding protein n=1 Tax=Anaerosalibacter massiliensis TaxID=1347392 RepID=A0A9X2S6M5_9FIRM|nr:ATP-binding protein [Anaerosalibacter massiliensis]MCR2043231.1 ATP-binding protein [Anaerosalibacter massiliensis]